MKSKLTTYGHLWSIFCLVVGSYTTSAGQSLMPIPIPGSASLEAPTNFTTDEETKQLQQQIKKLAADTANLRRQLRRKFNPTTPAAIADSVILKKAINKLVHATYWGHPLHKLDNIQIDSFLGGSARKKSDRQMWYTRAGKTRVMADKVRDAALQRYRKALDTLDAAPIPTTLQAVAAFRQKTVDLKNSWTKNRSWPIPSTP